MSEPKFSGQVFLSTKEVAEMAGVSKSLIIMERRLDNLRPAARIGSVFGFSQRSVERWMEKRAANARS